MPRQKLLTVSIIIPCFNEEKYLADCLKSVFYQSVLPTEVIVVDNNSTDKSLQVVRRYKKVKVVKEKNQGLSFARNKGFNLAASDIICRIDADTILPKNWLKSLEADFEQAGRPRLYAATGPVEFRNGGPKILWKLFHRLSYFWFAKFILGHQTIFGPNTIISRDLWLKIAAQTCQRNDIHEDMDLAYHINHQNVGIHFRPSLRSSVVARGLWPRLYKYPVMMFKIKLISHAA